MQSVFHSMHTCTACETCAYIHSCSQTHTHIFQSRTQFLGSDILHVYNKQQARHRLNANGLYIANTKPSGFTIEVCNLLSTAVAVGVRVLLGCQSTEKAPSSIEVFSRSHPVSFPSGSYRWVDIPFTREETLQGYKTFKINCE